jgi:hypothetical protein
MKPAAFVPAAWLLTHGFVADDVSVVLDQMTDEGAPGHHLKAMLDCCDETLYHRAVGIYQMFDWALLRRETGHSARRAFLPGDGSLDIMGMACRVMVGATKRYLAKSKAFHVKTAAKTSTRQRHAAAARDSAVRACGAAMALAHAVRGADLDLCATMDRLTCRLAEGVRQIDAYVAVLGVRLRHDLVAAGRDVAGRQKKWEARDVKALTTATPDDLAASLAAIGLDAADLTRLVATGRRLSSRHGEVHAEQAGDY